MMDSRILEPTRGGESRGRPFARMLQSHATNRDAAVGSLGLDGEFAVVRGVQNRCYTVRCFAHVTGKTFAKSNSEARRKRGTSLRAKVRLTWQKFVPES